VYGTLIELGCLVILGYLTRREGTGTPSTSPKPALVAEVSARA
jgi:hypothetical protein